MSQIPSTTGCLGCGVERPAPFLDLGTMPLANSYLDPQDVGDETGYPLAVAYCPRCQLVQITNPLPPEQLFTEYAYYSSYSDSFVEHAREMAVDLVAKLALGPESKVLEIASNDGYLLRHFQQQKIAVLGIEPAQNIASEALRRGVPTLSQFFGPDAVDKIIGDFGPADLIIGNNVLAHVPRINEFLVAVARCMKDSGVAVFEFPYLRDLLAGTQFDTVYHEHVFYYSLTAVDTLARRASLEVTDVAWQPVHGGSLRVFLRHGGEGDVGARVREMMKEEKQDGLTGPGVYQGFGDRVSDLRQMLRETLQQLRCEGLRIAAYGAPAKGNTLLNYCGIGLESIEFTVDKSPHKQGKVLPGSHIPIRPPEALLRERPDYTVILPWNIAPEILEQQRDYTASGGRFIVPIPRPRVV